MLTTNKSITSFSRSVFLPSLIISCSPILVKGVMQEVNPIIYVICMCSFAGLFSLLITYLRNQPLPTLQQMPIIALWGMFARIVPALLVAFSLTILPASIVVLCFCLEPLIQILFGLLFLGEKPTRKQLFALTLAIIGFSAIGISSIELIMSGCTDWRGYIAVLVAMLASRAGWVGAMKFIRSSNLLPFTVNGAMMLSGAILLAPLSLYYTMSYTMSPSVLGIIAAIACIELIGYGWWVGLSRWYSAGYLAFSCLISPLMSMALAALFLGEPLSLYLIPALIVVIIGLRMYEK